MRRRPRPRHLLLTVVPLLALGLLARTAANAEESLMIDTWPPHRSQIFSDNGVDGHVELELRSDGTMRWKGHLFNNNFWVQEFSILCKLKIDGVGTAIWKHQGLIAGDVSWPTDKNLDWEHRSKHEAVKRNWAAIHENTISFGNKPECMFMAHGDDAENAGQLLLQAIKAVELVFAILGD